MRQRINKNLILIALLAVLASVISITYIYYGMFQERVRSDLEVCIELLKDTHYLESPDIDPPQRDHRCDQYRQGGSGPCLRYDVGQYLLLCLALR